MKSLVIELNRLIKSGKYSDYRLVISPNKIELKLIPRKSNEEEINWIKNNNKYEIIDLNFQLTTIEHA